MALPWQSLMMNPALLSARFSPPMFVARNRLPAGCA